MTAALAEAVATAAGGTLAGWRTVPGGDINAAMRVELADGRSLFAKHRDDPPAGFYAAEAVGLRWLGEAGALPVPQVAAADERFLTLTWIDAGPRRTGFEATLGAGLARLHLAGADAFGATPGDLPAFLGPIRLPTGGHASGVDAPARGDGGRDPDAPARGDGGRDAGDDGVDSPRDRTWAQVYAEDRLGPLLRLASDGGALTAQATSRVERVIDRMDALAGPPERPARVHGDLWTGNVMAGPDGGPVLVDPAAHGGHRETDLAMLRLFGSPGPAFLDAYEDVAPLADGAEERVALWQLAPLLLHAVLFGGGYGSAVDRAARRYTD